MFIVCGTTTKADLTLSRNECQAGFAYLQDQRAFGQIPWKLRSNAEAQRDEQERAGMCVCMAVELYPELL